MFQATKLGMAIMKNNLSPEEGLMVYLDLQNAQQRIVLQNELHLLYLLTPVISSGGINTNWRLFHSIFRKLTPIELQICDCIGISENSIVMFSQQSAAGPGNTDFKRDVHFTHKESS